MAALLDQLVSDVIRSAERNQRSDFELLDAYARGGDSAAFEALVRRHGPVVLATCRRVLPGADADDAFQATFLALSKHAPRIRTAVGGWLVSVAHRAAVRMRAAAQRRAEVEANHNGPSDEPRDPSWRESCAILHQELDAMPDGYRRPLVLCYLAGLTRDEAARELGVSAETVKGRLERGRIRLRKRLARRGISLTAGLIGVAVAESSASAIPARLVRAAIAEPTPAVAAIARAAVDASTSWLRWAGAGLAAAVLISGVALGLPGDKPLDDSKKDKMPAPPRAAKADAKPEKPTEVQNRTITGTVVDPAGKPVAGAEIVFLPIEGKPTIAAKSGDDGKFSATVVLKSPGAWMFARVPGFGSNFLMPAGNTPADVTFALVKDAPIRGRVVTTEGKPVAGVAVNVIHIRGTEEKSLDKFLAGWLKRDPYDQHLAVRGTVHWGEGPRDLPDGRHVYGMTTGPDGAFEITNVGSERIVTLSVRGPGIAYSQPLVVTRTGFDAAPYNRASKEQERQEGENGLGYHPTFLSPNADIVVEAEKPIRGTVTALDTGKPLAGATVRLRSGWRLRLPEPSAKTDANGRFEIHGARKNANYELYVNRVVDQGLLGRTVKVRDTEALSPITADIALARGIVLSGRVLDTSTGKAVPGFCCVGVLFDNEFVKKPEFSTPDCYDFANTNADGVFRTVVPPGSILLMGGPHPTGGKQDVQFKYQQQKPDPDYPDYFDKTLSGFRSPGGGVTIMQGMYCKVLKLQPDLKEFTADVILKPASEFRVRVVDASGKSVTKFVAAGTTSREWMHAESHDGDTGVVYDLDPKHPRVVAVFDPASGQVGTMSLKGEEKQPAEIKLGPAAAIKGRAVTPTGEPLKSTRLLISYLDRPVEEIDRAWHSQGEYRGQIVETDADGRFEFKGVVPGAPLLVYGRRGAEYLRPPSWDRKAAHIAKPGETIDIGTVTLKEE
jgi:RNA polymerase sigma factor (sigma-70 family)